jgi:hypothetical protein
MAGGIPRFASFMRVRSDAPNWRRPPQTPRIVPLLLGAVGVVPCRRAGIHLLDQTVNIGLKAGALGVEFAGRASR